VNFEFKSQNDQGNVCFSTGVNLAPSQFTKSDQEVEGDLSFVNSENEKFNSLFISNELI
jgi:hypothetical protein